VVADGDGPSAARNEARAYEPAQTPRSNIRSILRGKRRSSPREVVVTPAPPFVFRAELPTPDLVVVRGGDGGVTLFADSRLPDSAVDDALEHLDSILAGPPHALG
jgi:hypothetical protein